MSNEPHHNKSTNAENSNLIRHPADKYGGEALGIVKLLETEPLKAAARLQQDSRMGLHEFRSLFKEIQKAYAADKSTNASLPNVIFADGRDGFKVGVDDKNTAATSIVFEKKTDELTKQRDKPIPQTGELLNLTSDQTMQILGIQKKEKIENGGKSHKFGDIAVSLGFKTPTEVNAALATQDHLRASQVADDESRAIPLGQGEGYFQVAKRMHPAMADEDAVKLAHRMKQLNHNQTHLVAGSELPVMNGKQRAEAEVIAYKDNRKRTGSVAAKPGQPLSEIPMG